MELKPAPLKLRKKHECYSLNLEVYIKDLKCTGLTHGQGVIVTTPEDIYALVKLGSYGKGIFSRSIPWHKYTLHTDKADLVTKTQETSRNEQKFPENSLAKRMKISAREDDRSESEVDEYLQLCAEEAFYLMAEVGILSVMNKEGKQLSSSELWIHFSKISKSFGAKYSAYVHYRIGNWIPKSGLKFGVDFLLYKEGPLSYHSSFAAMVKEAKQKSLPITWKEVIALNRVNEGAGKDLLICYANNTQDITEDQLMQSSCTPMMVIKDMVVKRWVPEKDREVL